MIDKWEWSVWEETFTIGVFILSLRLSASSCCAPAHGTFVCVRAEPFHTVPVRQSAS